MSRKKRISRILEKAEVRSAGLKSINLRLDLGNGLTVTNYLERIDTLRNQLNDYNAALANIDKSQNDLIDLEKMVNDLTERMLLGVATHYGKNSNEYEMAGGIRKSDRKRPVRAKAA